LSKQSFACDSTDKSQNNHILQLGMNFILCKRVAAGRDTHQTWCWDQSAELSLNQSGCPSQVGCQTECMQNHRHGHVLFGALSVQVPFVDISGIPCVVPSNQDPAEELHKTPLGFLRFPAFGQQMWSVAEGRSRYDIHKITCKTINELH
jgi:hypothetical protein